jgi:gluconate 5-dehydrogenase
VLAERGKVTGIKVMSSDKTSYTIRAKTVILSSSTFETPRILLHSGIPGRAIGHYLQPHAFVQGAAVVNIKDISNSVGGVSIWIPQTNDQPFGMHMWGGGYKESPLEAEREIVMNGFGKVEPRFENKVTLDLSNLDDYGVPRIRVNFSYSAKDQFVIEQTSEGAKQASAAMQARLSRVELLPPGSDAHESGTCRMGEDPSSSATNQYGQIHGVSGLYLADNSVLPTLGGTSPTLTTIALAIRTADHIIGQLK